MACAVATSTVLSAPATQPSKVTQADQVQFQQSNVAAQMQELQERMFRLAELTRQAEPDDSARLILAVKQAREQLIVEQMKDVLDLLGHNDLGKAADDQQQVLVKLEELKQLLLATDLNLQMQLEQLRKLQAAIKKLDAAIAEEKREHAQTGQLATTQPATRPVIQPSTAAPTFAKLQQDQQQNRKDTDAVTQTAKELGQSGAKASEGLASASQSMTSAEASLGGQKPTDAQASQAEAIKSLQQARADLEQERQKILQELQKQVRKQVMDNLAEMLDRQKSIRAKTESLRPDVEAGHRVAVLGVEKLAVAERRLVDIADQTVHLIEQTEFSFTLPPAIRDVQRQCAQVTAQLEAGTDNMAVIDAEQQIEKDLADLLDTLKDPNITSGKGSGCKSCKGNKNKLLAELRVLRLLQSRVNQQTRQADGGRQGAAQIPPDLRGRILTVRDSQAQVQSATDRLRDALIGDEAATKSKSD